MSWKLFSKKPKLGVIVDNISYVRSNCYIHQLAETLESEFNVTFFEIPKIKAWKSSSIEKQSAFLLMARLRSYPDYIDELKNLIFGKRTFVYEQDPWECFSDQGHYPGIYQKLFDEIKIEKFMVTSPWWTKHIQSLGLPARFVRMGTLARYCRYSIPWPKRTVKLAFQGSLHPYRKKLFAELEKRGHKVSILSSSPYKKFLRKMQNVQIFVHSEQAQMSVNGKPVPLSVSWAKSIEVAAQGALVLRDYEEDGFNSYGISEIPSVFTYRDYDDAASKLNEMQNLSASEREKIIHTSLEVIARRNDWGMVCKEIQSQLNRPS